MNYPSETIQNPQSHKHMNDFTSSWFGSSLANDSKRCAASICKYASLQLRIGFAWVGWVNAVHVDLHMHLMLVCYRMLPSEPQIELIDGTNRVRDQRCTQLDAVRSFVALRWKVPRGGTNVDVTLWNGGFQSVGTRNVLRWKFDGVQADFRLTTCWNSNRHTCPFGPCHLVDHASKALWSQTRIQFTPSKAPEANQDPSIPTKKLLHSKTAKSSGDIRIIPRLGESQDEHCPPMQGTFIRHGWSPQRAREFWKAVVSCQGRIGLGVGIIALGKVERWHVVKYANIPHMSEGVKMSQNIPKVHQIAFLCMTLEHRDRMLLQVSSVSFHETRCIQSLACGTSQKESFGSTFPWCAGFPEASASPGGGPTLAASGISPKKTIHDEWCSFTPKLLVIRY